MKTFQLKSKFKIQSRQTLYDLFTAQTSNLHSSNLVALCKITTLLQFTFNCFYYFKHVGNLQDYKVNAIKSVYLINDSEFKTCLEEY